MEYLGVLGRQPKLSLAELECLYGAPSVEHFSSTTSIFSTENFDIEKVGGLIKAGEVVLSLRKAQWREVSTKVIHFYSRKFAKVDHKITIGISVYDWDVPARDIQKLGLILKSSLKKSNVSVRLIPNQEQALSSATSHHNKLGLSSNKIELLISKDQDGNVVVAQSTGSQNISSLAARDQERPKRDAFVGMLPPKLALMMVNLSGVDKNARILDPFCGTGVVLQESTLLGHDVYGTDLSEKMVDYSTANMKWLLEKQRLSTDVVVHHGDAMETTWHAPIGAVVAETYLGQPFSAPPAADKLLKVQRICNEVISKFLLNLAPQIEKDTPLCLAVPAWRDSVGRLSYLSLSSKLDRLGYETIALKHATASDLVYFREDQIVARQLLLLRRK
jgi:tRNA G10  N-methylase Trm11